jgi:hypothetical protein
MKHAYSIVGSNMSICRHVVHMGSQIVASSLAERVTGVAERDRLVRNTFASLRLLTGKYLITKLAVPWVLYVQEDLHRCQHYFQRGRVGLWWCSDHPSEQQPQLQLG